MSEAPKIYSPEYYQRLYELEDRHWWNRGMKKVAAALLEPSMQNASPTRILDAGCGTGNFMDWLGRFSKAQRVGIDISSHALRFCRERNYQNISVASVANLPFRDESFHLITCNDVLQHAASKDETILHESFRVLKTDGLLYLRTNAAQKYVFNDDPAEDYHRYTREEILAKAANAGFAVLRATFANSIPSIAADFRNWLTSRKPSDHHHGKKNVYSGLVMRVPPEPFNTILFWFMNAEARYLSAQNSSLSFGHSLVFLLQKPSVK